MKSGPGIATLVVLCLSSSGCGGGGGGASGPPPAQTVPHVTMQVTGPSGPIPGNEVGYVDIVLTSDGTKTAQNVLVTPTWGPGVGPSAIDAVQCTATGDATCTYINVTWSVPSMPVGSTVSLHVPVAASGGAPSPLHVSLTVTADGQVAKPADTVALSIETWSTSLRVAGEGPLTLSPSDSTVTWIVNVLNDGPQDARQFQLTDTADPSQTVTGVTCTAFGGASCPAAPAMSMTLPGMPLGGRLRFAVTASIAPASGQMPYNYMESVTHGDVNPFDNASLAESPVVDPPSPSRANYVDAQGDPGDFLGQGNAYALNQVNSIWQLNVTGASASVSASGDNGVGVGFTLPASYTQLVPGTWSFGLPDIEGRPALQSGGAGVDSRACDVSSGVVTIDRADYVGGVLSALDFRMTNHCENADAALHAQVHWQASDTSSPAGPTLPIPAGLWSAPAQDVPAAGNYVIVQTASVPLSISVIAGSDVQFSPSTQGGPILYFDFNQAGTFYSVDFLPMAPLTQLQPGYYPHVKNVGGSNRAYGGLSWAAAGQTCASTLGWFAIDNIQWSGAALVALDARFSLTCGSLPDPLYGQIHWVGP